MRIAAHTKHARLEVSLLRQNDVANAQTVVDMGQFLFNGPFTCNANNSARIVITFWHIVVHDQDHSRLVPNFSPQLFQHRLKTARSRGVMKHGQINLAVHNVTHRNVRSASSLGNQFLRKCLRRICRLTHVSNLWGQDYLMSISSLFLSH